MVLDLDLRQVVNKIKEGHKSFLSKFKTTNNQKELAEKESEEKITKSDDEDDGPNLVKKETKSESLRAGMTNSEEH